MPAAPVNNDLPLSNGVPGVYIRLDLSGAGSAADNSARRALLLGYRSSTGTYGPDTPVRVSSKSDVDTFFGQGSDVARLFYAFQSHIGSGAADIYLCGINEPSGGTAATYLIIVAGTATSAGAVDVWICGHKVSVGIANGDAAATIATNLKNTIDLVKDIPVTAGVSSGTVTLTYRHKGIVGEDCPIIVNQTGATGVTFSPGDITYATNATGSGTITISVGGTTISASVANLDTPTVIATAMKNAINAGSYPITATSSSGVVTFLYNTDRAVRRISRSMGAVTGTTGTLAVGTSGAGTPTLTTALTNIGAQSAFGVWCTSFNETTSLGTLATHVNNNADGLNQKGQVLHFGSADKLATAGALPTGSSPSLTGFSRYMLAWCVDAPQQAYELAARCAANYLDQNYVAHNPQGDVLKSKSANVPLLLPHPNVRPNLDDQNAAIMTYFMTPLVVNANNELVILRGVTTSNSSDFRLRAWSGIKQIDNYRAGLRARLVSLFPNKSLKRTGTPHTPNAITTSSVENATFVFNKELDDQDLYDGAEATKAAIKCNVNASVSTRLDLFAPYAPLVDLAQIGATVGV